MLHCAVRNYLHSGAIASFKWAFTFVRSRVILETVGLSEKACNDPRWSEVLIGKLCLTKKLVNMDSVLQLFSLINLLLDAKKRDGFFYLDSKLLICAGGLTCLKLWWCPEIVFSQGEQKNLWGLPRTALFSGYKPTHWCLKSDFYFANKIVLFGWLKAFLSPLKT